MAEQERVSESDRMEQAGLERAVADIERVVLASPPGTRPLFNGFLLNAKARLGVLEKKIHDAEREQQNHATNELAVVELAQKETRLSAQERQTYSGFLKEDFFTKKDFAKLDDFYAHSWDRLSEHGKDEMSHRIWEGVRKGEYKFSELPKSVREKETKRAYEVLKERETGTGKGMNIPEQDRADFIRAYEGGKRDEAAKVLERDSFKKSMFPSESTRVIKSKNVDAARDTEGRVVGREIAAGAALADPPRQAAKGATKADQNIADLNLDGIKLAEVSKEPTVADMPQQRGAPDKGSPSVRGS